MRSIYIDIWCNYIIITVHKTGLFMIEPKPFNKILHLTDQRLEG